MGGGCRVEDGGWRVEGFGRAPVATGDHDVIERSEALQARLLLCYYKATLAPVKSL